MAGPWEAYGGGSAASDGPWSAYQGGETKGADGKIRVRISTAPDKPDNGYIDAAARGAASGLTANFSDEIQGARAAAPKIPIGPNSEMEIPDFVGPIPARALAGAARMGVGYLTGNDQPLADYRAARDEMRAGNKAAEENYPLTSLAGNVAGTVALPVGAGAGAASMGARMLAGSGVGAALGGAAGVGEGEGIGNTIAKGVTGVAAGGVLGGFAPVAIKGLELAGRGIAKVAQPIIGRYRAARDPDAVAARTVETAFQRDAASAKPGLTDEAYDAARASGSPVINADRGGEATQAIARSAANNSPEGRAALEVVTSERYKEQSPRMANWLRETFDFPEPGPTLDRLQEAARRENRPAYLKAYSDGANIPFDEGLQQLSQAPVVQDAIRKAMITAKNEAAKLDLPPPKNPFRFDESGYLRPMANADGSMMTPNLQFWDIVKRNLDKTGTQESKDWARVLREHLDDLVPSGSYKEARSGAAKYFGAEDAMEAGAKFATMSGRDAMAISEARKGLAKLKAGERKLFETGFVSNLIAKIDDLKEGQDIVKQIYNSTFAKKQMVMALGAERAAELEAKLLAERAMNGINTALKSNSTTARQWIERTMAGGSVAVGGVGAYDMDPKQFGAAVLTGALLAGNRKIDQRVARRVAEMLASDNPKLLEAGNRIVAKSQAMRDALLKLDLPAVRVAGEQSSALPALQSAGVSRAEDQPGVPRPPGQ
jgi:hypothetical protein